MKDYWTTAQGEQIKYPDLTDSHLNNIINDGYRNDNLIEECRNRGYKVPARLIDALPYEDLCIWVESFASCAIEGNKVAMEMNKLWHENKAKFLLRLNVILMNKDNKWR